MIDIVVFSIKDKSFGDNVGALITKRALDPSAPLWACLCPVDLIHGIEGLWPGIDGNSDLVVLPSGSADIEVLVSMWSRRWPGYEVTYNPITPPTPA